ncbi:MAG: rhomboid family intramembrane serine protease [Desulfobulbaceae bacterium]|nr:rhomboid family intramembrane serine protease [Desulfobulbaceae bacterium]
MQDPRHFRHESPQKKTPEDGNVQLQSFEIPPDECSLVLWAMGIPHRFDENHSHILIMEEDLEEAQRQLTLYLSENSNYNAQSIPIDTQKVSPLPTLLACLAVIYFYLITGPWQNDNPWFARGAGDGFAILQQNQWYRCLTSLTLHADAAHLLGNVIVGGILIHFLCGQIGFGAAWILVLLSGTLGNIISIELHPPTYSSVGLSTGIFGAVGILSGLQLFYHPIRKKGRLLLPLGAGLSLLALLGSSEGRTDLPAHLFGLLSGIFLGSFYHFSAINALLRLSPYAQFWCYALSLISVSYAWHLAWS